MNKLNKIFSVVVFVFFLLSTVFITNSYANADIFKEGQTLLTQKDYCGATKTSSTLPSYVEGASQAEQRKFIMSTLYDYFNNRTNVDYDFTNFNHLIDTSLNYYSDLYSKNYNGYYILADYISTSAYTSTFKLYFYQKNDIDILYDKIKTVSGTYHQSVSFIDGSDFIFINLYSSGFSSNYYENTIGNCFFRLNQYYQKYSFSSNTSIKQSDTSIIDGSESNTYIFTWDGTSYYQYIDDSDTPTFPTNSEIASAVQKFYNSDIYKNNTNFNDFYVVYSSLNNTYAFICTDQNLFQHIYYDGVSNYYGFSSPDTWWCFYNSEGLIDSLFNNEKFYLYFIEGNSDIITNEGVGLVSELCDLKFTTGMTIVYCTHDYIVYEHRPPSEGETDNQVTSGTIEGDSYTYDENLDITDSQYSPLQNFVSSNPTQSILNDVDFDSINQAFEDSKGILNIQGASWIFTANNQLVDYFIGFITLLIILLVISRLMGG